MKKVNYGFDISDNPVGAFEGIGIQSKPEGPVEADFLGIINYEGEDYLIGRTTLAFKDDPNYLGKITARRATASIYPDGTGTIFLDMNENNKTRKIEEVLESRNIQEGTLAKKVNHRYDSVISGNEIYATSIKTEIFDKKKMINDSLDGKKDTIPGKYY